NTGNGLLALSEKKLDGGTETPTNARATVVVNIPGTKNDLKITANRGGDAFNGVVSIINSGRSKKKEDVYATWNPSDHLVGFDVNAASTANDVMAAMTFPTNLLENFDAEEAFKVELNTPDTNLPNDGTGVVQGVSKQGLKNGTGIAAPRWVEIASNLPNAI